MKKKILKYQSIKFNLVNVFVECNDESCLHQVQNQTLRTGFQVTLE